MIKVVKRFKNQLSNDLIFDGIQEDFHTKYALNEEGNRIEANSLIYFIKIADANGKKVKSTKEFCCDITYCNLLENQIDDIIQNLELQINNFKKMNFTIEQFKKYLESQDSLGDVHYNLSIENILKANEVSDIIEIEDFFELMEIGTDSDNCGILKIHCDNEHYNFDISEFQSALEFYGYERLVEKLNGDEFENFLIKSKK